MDGPPATAPISTPIPYRAQQTGWTCGAASLRMVYASFGLELTEQEVWASLVPDPRDRSGVRASRLAWEAGRRGFAAIAVKAGAPWDLIRAAAARGVRLVFTQPLSRGSPRRHFSVLAEAAEGRIVLHDPQHGAGLGETRAGWLELWGASYGNPRATVNELVAIARPPLGPSSCTTCGARIPESLTCPACGGSIPLRPAEVLACVALECPGRLWSRVMCPSCDLALDGREDWSILSDPLRAQENAIMFDNPRFGKLGKAIQDHQRLLARAQGESPEAGLGEMLASLQKVMNDSADQLAESLDRLDEKNEERARQVAEKRAASARKLEEAMKAREEALAKLAAKQAAKAARPQPRQQAEDPHLGAKLRDKLLEEFGTRVDRRPAGEPGAGGSLIDFDPGAR